MQITDYIVKEYGDISFQVDSEAYSNILLHLKAKGLTAGGHHNSDSDDSDITVTATIEQVNEALADFGA